MRVPTLRFPEFTGEWGKMKFGDIYSYRSTNSFSRDNLNYENGQVKNIHYGDIHTKFNLLFDITKEFVPFVNNEISLDKLPKDNYCKEGDLIIADASEDYADIGKCIEIVNLNNEKIVAGLHTIHARPEIDKISFGYSGYMMKSEKVRTQIMTFAQGTKVLSISMGRLSDMKLILPTLAEQTKIANFLTAVDKKIGALENQITLQEQYKRGILQKIFAREITFKDDSGNNFPEWKERKLSTILLEHKTISTGKEEVHSVSVHKGIINQVDHLGRVYAADNVSNYNLVKPGDIVYTKSPTGDFPWGIIKQSKLDKDVIVSPLYGVFTPETYSLGVILDAYFTSKVNTTNYLASIVQKGAKNTINITNTTFLSKSLILPVSKDEQKKIADFLLALDTKISVIRKQVEIAKEWKKGLLQQMFVSNDAVVGAKTLSAYREVEGEMLVAAER